MLYKSFDDEIKALVEYKKEQVNNPDVALLKTTSGFFYLVDQNGLKELKTEHITYFVTPPNSSLYVEKAPE